MKVRLQYIENNGDIYDTIIDSLVVRWPDLSEQTIINIKADQFITLYINNASLLKN